MNKRFKIIPKQQPTKPKTCIACNGSGYYDHNGSPPCSSCDGQGFILKNNENKS